MDDDDDDDMWYLLAQGPLLIQKWSWPMFKTDLAHSQNWICPTQTHGRVITSCDIVTIGISNISSLLWHTNTIALKSPCRKCSVGIGGFVCERKIPMDAKNKNGFWASIKARHSAWHSSILPQSHASAWNCFGKKTLYRHWWVRSCVNRLNIVWHKHIIAPGIISFELRSEWVS